MLDFTIRCKCQAPATIQIDKMPLCRGCALAAIDGKSRAPTKMPWPDDRTAEQLVLAAVAARQPLRAVAPKLGYERARRVLGQLRATGRVTLDARLGRYRLTPELATAF